MKYPLLLLVFIVFFSNLCVSSQDLITKVDTLESDFYFNKDWLYKADKNYLYKMSKPDNIYEKSDLPLSVKYEEGAYVYYKNYFTVSEKLREEKIYMWFGKTKGALEVYINGILMGQFGTMPPKYFESAFNDKFIYLPEGVIKYGETNEIQIKHFSDGPSTAFNICYLINEKRYKDFYSLSYFLNITLYQVFLGIFLFIAIFAIFLFIRNKQSFEYIFFTMGSLFFAGYLFNFFMEGFFLKFLLIKAITHGMIIPALASFIIFLSKFFNIYNNKKFISATIISAIVLYSGFFFQRNSVDQLGWFNISLIYLVFTLVITIILSYKALKKGSRYALPILVGILSTIPAAIHDSLFSIIDKEPLAWFQGTALVIYVLSMFYAIAKTLMDLFADVGIKSKAILEAKNNLEMLINESVNVSDTLIDSGKTLDNNISIASSLNKEMIDYNIEFNKTINNEKKLIDNINDSIQDIAISIKNLNENIDFESDLIENTSSSINNLSKSIKEVKMLSANAENISNGTFSTIKSGYNKIKKTENMILELENESENILQTINVINDISERTNILAMNAAIESARAGKFGEGFSIISKEIRNLSSSTKKNSEEIRINLEQILNKIKGFVDDFALLMEELRTIMEHSTKTKSIIIDINNAVAEEDKNATLITNSTKQLNIYKEEINKISKNQKTMSHIIKESSENLEKMSNEILDFIKKQDDRNNQFSDIIAKLKEFSARNLSLSNMLSDAIKKGQTEN